MGIFFKTQIEFIKLKSTMAEMKYTLSGIKGKLDISKEITSECEDNKSYPK